MSKHNTDILDLIPLKSSPKYKSIFPSEKRLNNRYILGKELGSGGLSAVFDAKDDYSEYYGDDRRLAIKIPLEHLSHKSDIDAFMYAEYAHLSSLSHQNIVKVIDFGIDADNNVPYIVLEQLSGRLLKEIPLYELSKHFKSNLLYTLYETLQYIHSKGIIHADINPANIMCLYDGSIRLFDFGISKNLNKKQLFELDYTNIKAYNPRYAAPEIIEGAVPDQNSDLFSLSVVLFELFTGKIPYSTQSTELHNNPISKYDLKQIPFFLRRWFKSTLSPIPSQRNAKFPLFLNIKKYI
ncbi:MAG: serine/threonine-protein kinase [Sulfuricurvum sp.]|nr:serine/threonine-protein kinase [Sulfuricurvum sp.]